MPVGLFNRSYLCPGMGEDVFMMLFTFFMGAGGLFLAGDSIGVGVRNKDVRMIALGVVEIIAGLYFMVAAIGSCQ